MKKVLYVGLNPPTPSKDQELVHLPVIQIIPRDSQELCLKKSLENFSLYTHILITSKNAAKILADYLPLFGYDLSDWRAKKTISIGQMTSSYLRSLGIIPCITAQEETSEGVIEELPSLSLDQDFIFWPHAAGSRPVIPNALKARQLTFVECVLYDTLPLYPDHKPSLQEFDEIIFTSPSTVDAFLAIFESFPSHATLKSIGPITRSHLEKLNKN